VTTDSINQIKFIRINSRSTVFCTTSS